MMKDCTVCECSPDEIPKPWLEEVNELLLSHQQASKTVCWRPVYVVHAKVGYGRVAAHCFLWMSTQMQIWKRLLLGIYPPPPLLLIIRKLFPILV